MSRTPRSVARPACASLFAVTVAAAAVIGSATAATGTADRTGGDQADTGVTEEYVVAFSGSPAAAAATIRAAGGTVEDMTEQLGVARVTSSDGAFLTQLRGRSGISGAALNHAVGTAAPGMPHRFAMERPSAAERATGTGSGDTDRQTGSGSDAEPLAGLQWDMEMIGATPDAAHRSATGRGVDVGIIDTGIDASHPDLAANIDGRRSRNFTTDIPAIDGPCEFAGCVDPANVDDAGHGTHVAGIVAADDNGFGIGGVAPDATLVNLRAGQDSGFFFLYETVQALVYAGDIALDVVNMSFYTDPWLYNCASRDDYVTGGVSDEEIVQQRLIRMLLLDAVAYAHRHRVTLVGSAGNDFTDLAAPTRRDATSPDYPGPPNPRTVKNDCLILPNEAPEVISVSAVGPSTTKADYSNYGLGSVEIAAPGGWYRDFVGTPDFRTPGNMVLSSYPLHVAVAEGLADPTGRPFDDFSLRYCAQGRCGFYTYLQGTSMASPHVAGVAALIVEEFGRPTARGGRALDPSVVAGILERTAEDHACPAAGVEIYTDEGRTPPWNAVCQGTTQENGLYGEGIVDAVDALR
jgi:lantibiotic leader peptide-processing serine protease